jgi:hypothetical protein
MNIKTGNAGKKKKEGSEEEATKGGDYDEKYGVEWIGTHHMLSGTLPLSRF